MAPPCPPLQSFVLFMNVQFFIYMSYVEPKLYDPIAPPPVLEWHTLFSNNELYTLRVLYVYNAPPFHPATLFLNVDKLITVFALL